MKKKRNLFPKSTSLIIVGVLLLLIALWQQGSALTVPNRLVNTASTKDTAGFFGTAHLFKLTGGADSAAMRVMVGWITVDSLRVYLKFYADIWLGQSGAGVQIGSDTTLLIDASHNIYRFNGTMFYKVVDSLKLTQWLPDTFRTYFNMEPSGMVLFPNFGATDTLYKDSIIIQDTVTGNGNLLEFRYLGSKNCFRWIQLQITPPQDADSIFGYVWNGNIDTVASGSDSMYVSIKDFDASFDSSGTYRRAWLNKDSTNNTSFSTRSFGSHRVIPTGRQIYVVFGVRNYEAYGNTGKVKGYFGAISPLWHRKQY